MSKKGFEKLWSGSANFVAKEDFDTIEAATKQPLPSSRAIYEVNADSISFEFKRVRMKGAKDGSRAYTKDSLSKDQSGDRRNKEQKKSDSRKDHTSREKK